MIILKGFYLERKQSDETTRPYMKDYDTVAMPIFHSRREAWKFMRAWGEGETTKQLRRLGYRCVPVKVETV